MSTNSAPKLDIAAIKARYNITDIAARYFNVMRRGARFVALCPFHADRHPSLTLSPTHAAYHCFACGAKGDIFSLVQHMEKCTFVEAAERITGGLFTAHTQPILPPPAEAIISEQTRIENTHFLTSLIPYTPTCRELTATYKDFEVGIAPTQPTQYYQTYSLQRMAGRLIFPIRNKAGELVGFSARLRDKAKERTQETAQETAQERTQKPSAPKYLNSSFTDGFTKGAHLYALHRALPFVQQTRTLYLVEGYKDALALHAAGLPNTVALCGTALTEQHIALLTSLAPQLQLLLDADKAGAAAAQRISQQLLHKVTCRICALPEGEDPDSLFTKQGAAWLRGMVK